MNSGKEAKTYTEINRDIDNKKKLIWFQTDIVIDKYRFDLLIESAIFHWSQTVINCLWYRAFFLVITFTNRLIKVKSLLMKRLDWDDSSKNLDPLIVAVIFQVIALTEFCHFDTNESTVSIWMPLREEKKIFKIYN